VTGGISSSEIRDLMIESVERRFGLITRLPNPIDADRKPAIQWHGRSLSETFQTQLRKGQPMPRRGERAAPARWLVRALHSRITTPICLCH
jgi:hypothetical protein